MTMSRRARPRRGLDRELRAAALRGDSEEARRLVLAGARVWILEPRPMPVSRLAREAGHERTAAAIDDAMVEVGHREEQRQRDALKTRCVPARELLAAVGGAGELVVTPCHGPFPQTAERLMVWTTASRGRLRLLRDAWIVADDVKVVRSELVGARWGGCDAMSAGSPRWIWARSGACLDIWRRRAVAVNAWATIANGQITRRRRLGWRRRPITEFSGVAVRLSPGWTRHRVVLTSGNGDVEVASRRSLAPALDVTYGEFELWVDAAWAEDLAAALGQVSGLPVKLPPPLCASPP